MAREDSPDDGVEDCAGDAVMAEDGGDAGEFFGAIRRLDARSTAGRPRGCRP